MSTSVLDQIKTPYIREIFLTIKKIQARMKELGTNEYIEDYAILSEEFHDFCDNYGKIFTNVVRGENLTQIAAVLFYKDKVERGLMTESELGDRLATQYLPKELKEESDSIIKNMKSQGKI